MGLLAAGLGDGQLVEYALPEPAAVVAAAGEQACVALSTGRRSTAHGKLLSGPSLGHLPPTGWSRAARTAPSSCGPSRPQRRLAQHMRKIRAARRCSASRPGAAQSFTTLRTRCPVSDPTLRYVLVQHGANPAGVLGARRCGWRAHCGHRFQRQRHPDLGPPGPLAPSSEKAAELAQKLGQPQPFTAVFPPS